MANARDELHRHAPFKGNESSVFEGVPKFSFNISVRVDESSVFEGVPKFSFNISVRVDESSVPGGEAGN